MAQLSNVIASLHNIYTLRGAPVRDPLNWSKYISQALHRFRVEADICVRARFVARRIQSSPDCCGVLPWQYRSELGRSLAIMVNH